MLICIVKAMPTFHIVILLGGLTTCVPDVTDKFAAQNLTYSPRHGGV
jgi:hypothetical protein